MIFIVEDDEIMAECIANALDSYETKIFSNTFDAISAMDGEDKLPKLIFLDILLDGPDAFTLLNELSSYPDTARIPIVLVSSLELGNKDFSAYGVVGKLGKDQMTPKELVAYAKRFA